MASNQRNTRSGITPDEKKLPFTISTTDAENYLQNVCDTMLYQYGEKTGIKQPKIEVRLYSSNVSEKYVPFVGLFPLSVVEGNEENEESQVVDDFFNVKQEDGTCRLKSFYYSMLTPFTFNSADKQMFTSDAWRHSLSVARDQGNLLRSLVEPKIATLEHGRLRMVEILIDPIRVFYEMLSIKGDNRPYYVDVTSIQRIRTGEYRYHVRRCLKNKKNKQYEKTLAEELNQMMKGYNRNRRQ